MRMEVVLRWRKLRALANEDGSCTKVEKITSHQAKKSNLFPGECFSWMVHSHLSSIHDADSLGCGTTGQAGLVMSYIFYTRGDSN